MTKTAGQPANGMLSATHLSLEMLRFPDRAATPAAFPLPGETHLYLIPLACNNTQLEELGRLLSVGESQRCNRLIDRQRREHATASRGLLRLFLAGYLDQEPGAVPLSEGEFGKPRLSLQPGSAALNFNLSHSGDFLLVGVSAEAIGVDLERIQGDLDFTAMARRYFSAHEQRDLFSLPATDRLPAFYRCWTRKEAYLKATGSGFSQPTDSFDVSLLPQHPPALLSHRIFPEEPARWTIKDVATLDGYCAAVTTKKQI